MARTFTVLGKPLHFTDQQLAYVSLRNSFEVFKNDLVIKIEIELEDCISDLDELSGEISSSVADCLKSTAEFSVLKLCENGIYDFDEVLFQQRLVEAAKCEDTLAPLLALDISLREIGAIEGGGGAGLIGGGFGAEGALKGMAMAGAVNLVTAGLSEGLAAGRRARAREAASHKLMDPKNFAKLSGVFEDLVDCGLLQTAQIILARDAQKLAFPTESDAKQSRALIANIAKGRIPEEARQEVLLQALQKNPYDAAAHVLLCASFPADDEREALADFLQIDVREHVANSEVTSALGEVTGVLPYWFDELKNIFARFRGKDLHVEPHIPERKIAGARKEYLKEGIGTPDRMESFQLRDLGWPVALLDTSMFGGGGAGITFTTTGFAWKEKFEEPKGVVWAALKSLDTNLERTIFGVRLFGSEIQLSGVDVSKQEFIELLELLRLKLEERKWVT